MIRVTVELLPYGYEEGKVMIASGTITNDGTGTLELGNYRARFESDGKAFAAEHRGHRRGDGILPLLLACLAQAFGKKLR